MIFFDQLKKNDTQLRMLAAAISLGLIVLLAGLWWVQIVNTRDFRSSLETQSFRTVRLPAVRGKILDRNGLVLADTRATYNISLFLEDFSRAFQKEFKRLRPKVTVTNSLPFWKNWLGFDAVKTTFPKLNATQEVALKWEARCNVVNQALQHLGAQLNTPLPLDRDRFKKHFATQTAMPYPVLRAVNRTQIARFEESASGSIAAELEIQTARVYPFSNATAHVLGYVVRKNEGDSVTNEQAYYSYRLPDFSGMTGIEKKYDSELRGAAGEKTVVINNLGYRQSETVSSPAEAGQNVVLTLDLRIQLAAERALRNRVGPNARGAVVVMDVNSGDVLALVSSPTIDPNAITRGFTPAEKQRWDDEELGVHKNRATGEQYQAGSIFKTMVALAALENGLKANELFRVQPNPHNPSRGIYYLGSTMIHDTAPPGDYDLRRALVVSCNTYFINIGLRSNVFERVVELGHRLHLGESIGHFPKPEMVRHWPAGEKANVCIGQGQMDVTPMQMAVMTAALANWGKVLQPRRVDRLESQDPTGLVPPTIFPKGVVRDQLGIQPKYLQIVRDAMLAETEDPEGTGHRYVNVPGLKICGKTGTAERSVKGVTLNTTWFISFAPYENPRHAVVVMVENGASGGKTCGPVAADVYSALIAPTSQPVNATVAGNN
ncbi:MAG: hypothetical protein EXS35_13130 [Pedosphaera sp.]|nr:hypothetical protein [Pedosphaera sp.]